MQVERALGFYLPFVACRETDNDNRNADKHTQSRLMRGGHVIRANQLAGCAQGDNDDNRNSDNRTQFALQPEPGVYNETIFKAIDRILAAADTSGLKVHGSQTTVT